MDAHRNGGGISAVHGNLMKLDPALQQYLTVTPLHPWHLKSPSSQRCVFFAMIVCCDEELSVHDVGMQQMTEAAVTRERAKLYAEVKENLLRQAASNDQDELALLKSRQVTGPSYTSSACCHAQNITMTCLERQPRGLKQSSHKPHLEEDQDTERERKRCYIFARRILMRCTKRISENH